MSTHINITLADGSLCACDPPISVDCNIGESEGENGVLLRELLNEANALTASCSDSLKSLYNVECSPDVSTELLFLLKTRLDPVNLGTIALIFVKLHR